MNTVSLTDKRFSSIERAVSQYLNALRTKNIQNENYIDTIVSYNGSENRFPEFGKCSLKN